MPAALTTEKAFLQNFSRTASDPLIIFNNSLDDCEPQLLNEAYLENKLNALEKNGSKDRSYFLTLARLVELTLFCAGAYADRGAFQETGDLLFNPRLIVVHIKGRCRPEKKWRHSAMTAQYGWDSADRRDVILWLKQNTLCEIKEKALLPHMVDGLSTSGHISEEYLFSVKQRTIKIADTIGFFAAYQVSDDSTILQRTAFASSAEKKMVESNLCRFNLKTFIELGRLFYRQVAEEIGERPYPLHLIPKAAPI